MLNLIWSRDSPCPFGAVGATINLSVFVENEIKMCHKDSSLGQSQKTRADVLVCAKGGSTANLEVIFIIFVKIV